LFSWRDTGFQPTLVIVLSVAFGSNSTCQEARRMDGILNPLFWGMKIHDVEAFTLSVTFFLMSFLLDHCTLG